ncbi:MAG: glycine cleavage system protein GcvH [Parachlamydiales bacterium]|nr:glycine cleavage system protein GcvH [Parachlamydiales bacterium]
MKYTTSHEWIHLEGNIATVGITQSVKDQLGDIIFVELPKVGSFVKKGSVVCIVESSKSASEIESPLSGQIVEVNAALQDQISLVNTSPEKEGWFFKVQIENEKEYTALRDMPHNQ